MFSNNTKKPIERIKQSIGTKLGQFFGWIFKGNPEILWKIDVRRVTFIQNLLGLPRLAFR
jgi:hypothetical protein